jgi:hypothetical protein
MIQSNENMAKIFDKANSSTKQKIALAYLGKVIKNHKKHILDAFTREGILLDADISDKMLISKIQNTLLQKNEQANNLKKSLAILILAKKDNFSDFFSYDTSDSSINLIFRELVEKDGKGVLKLFESLNIKLLNTQKENLIKRIRSIYFGKFILPKKRKIQKLFRIKIKELLEANGINKKSNFSDFFSLSKNKTPKTPKAPKQPKTPKVKAPKEAKTPKVKDGNMFTRTFKKGEDGTSKAGNFYRDNKEAINILGDTLIGGIATKWGKNAVNNNINNDVLDSSSENIQEPKKTPYLKYGLIVGGIAVVGFIVYKIIKRNK